MGKWESQINPSCGCKTDFDMIVFYYGKRIPKVEIKGVLAIKQEPEKEGCKMATNSFLKNINLREPKQCKDFIRALERSKERKEKEVHFSRPVSDMSREEIRKRFTAGENET